MLAWQSDKLESANFLKFHTHIFWRFLYGICAGLCKFAAGYRFLPVCIAFDWRCIAFLVDHVVASNARKLKDSECMKFRPTLTL